PGWLHLTPLRLPCPLGCVSGGVGGRGSGCWAWNVSWPGRRGRAAPAAARQRSDRPVRWKSLRVGHLLLLEEGLGLAQVALGVRYPAPEGIFRGLSRSVEEHLGLVFLPQLEMGHRHDGVVPRGPFLGPREGMQLRRRFGDGLMLLLRTFQGFQG